MLLGLSITTTSLLFEKILVTIAILLQFLAFAYTQCGMGSQIIRQYLLMYVYVLSSQHCLDPGFLRYHHNGL